MADRLLELRIVIPAEDDLHPDIVLDDFIADLKSVWLIEEMGAQWAAAETET